MKHVFIIIVIFVMTGMPIASIASEEERLNPEEVFYKANTAYGSGEYDKAVEEDESILKEGLKSGNLYYNLANAYFKKGELGKAILNYERARRLMPFDSDLLSNYRYVKGQMKRQDPPSKRLLVLQWLDLAMDYLTLKQMVILASALYYLIIILIIVTKVFGKFRTYSTVIILSLFVAIVIVFFPLSQKIKALRQGGIMVSRITDARFEPHKDATVNFPIYEGMKVYILRKRGAWCKIKRPDGKIGWVPQDTVSLIGI